MRYTVITVAFLIYTVITVCGCSNGDSPTRKTKFYDEICINGVTYLENGTPLGDNYSLTIKLNKASKVVPCDPGLKPVQKDAK